MESKVKSNSINSEKINSAEANDNANSSSMGVKPEKLESHTALRNLHIGLSIIPAKFRNDSDPLEKFHEAFNAQVRREVDKIPSGIRLPYSKERGHYSLLEVVLDGEFRLLKTLANYTKQNSHEVGDLDACTALCTRIHRFRNKLYGLLLIAEHGDHPSKALSAKIGNLLKAIYENRINLPYITEDGTIAAPLLYDNSLPVFSKTMKLLVRLLQSYEVAFKELLPGYLQTFAIPYGHVNMFLTHLQNQVNDVAPFGLFPTKERDFYYVLRMLVDGPYPRNLSAEQQKQWGTFYAEINTIAHFLLAIDKKLISFEKLYPYDKGQLINLPPKNFFVVDRPLSNNTFGRFNSVCTAFTAAFWLYVSDLIASRPKNSRSHDRKK